MKAPGNDFCFAIIFIVTASTYTLCLDTITCISTHIRTYVLMYIYTYWVSKQNYYLTVGKNIRERREISNLVSIWVCG